MSKLKAMVVTPGNVIALWHLIFLSGRFQDIEVGEAVAIVRNSNLLGGTIPIDGGLTLGMQSGVLEVSGNKLQASTYCKEKLYPLCVVEMPNIAAMRGMLFRILAFQRIDWLVYFDENAEIFKAFIPCTWVALLESAELFLMSDNDVRDWWTAVFARYKTYKEGEKLKLGKMVEKLAMEHELNRLELDGVKDTHFVVKWASEISDTFGYDIRSVRGTLLKLDYGERDAVKIEVKGSVGSSLQSFGFYISKNEWKTALEHPDSYYFYCWTGASLELGTAAGPYIVSAHAIKNMIPTDNSPECEWTQCRLNVDLETLRIF